MEVWTIRLSTIAAPSPGWFLWVLLPPENCCPPEIRPTETCLALMVSVMPSHTAPMLLYTGANAPAPRMAPRASGLVTGQHNRFFLHFLPKHVPDPRMEKSRPMSVDHTFGRKLITSHTPVCSPESRPRSCRVDGLDSG